MTKKSICNPSRLTEKTYQEWKQRIKDVNLPYLAEVKHHSVWHFRVDNDVYKVLSISEDEWKEILREV
jgi:hypothetical protein